MTSNLASQLRHCWINEWSECRHGVDSSLCAESDLVRTHRSETTRVDQEQVLEEILCKSLCEPPAPAVGESIPACSAEGANLHSVAHEAVSVVRHALSR